MSLLTKIASSSEGAEILMRSNIFEVLENCEFLESKPDINGLEGK